MTTSNKLPAATTLTGARDARIEITEVVGVIGGLVGAAVGVANGASVTAGIVGGITGAVGGYGMGNMLSVCNRLGAGTTIVGSTLSLSFGIICADLGTQMANAFCSKPTTATE